MDFMESPYCFCILSGAEVEICSAKQILSGDYVSNQVNIFNEFWKVQAIGSPPLNTHILCPAREVV